MPSELENVVDAFRTAVLAHDSRALATLAQSYGAAYRRIDGLLAGLLSKIEAARAAGEPVSVAWLMRQERYQLLMQQIAVELSAFAQAGAATIAGTQESVALLAGSHAESLVRASMGQAPVGVSVAWNRISREALRDLIGALQDGSPLLGVLTSAWPGVVSGVAEALAVGVLLGQNPRVIARSVRQAFGGSLTRTLTIARTETLRAYRTSALRAYQANEGLVKAWRWSAAIGKSRRRTCALCYAMHGRVFPLSTPFGSHPNCRCAAVPVTVTWAELGYSAIPNRPPLPMGEQVFAGLPESDQRAVLGPGKLALYQEGRIRLSDLVGERVDPQWGLVRWERSLRDIEGR